MPSVAGLFFNDDIGTAQLGVQLERQNAVRRSDPIKSSLSPSVSSSSAAASSQQPQQRLRRRELGQSSSKIATKFSECRKLPKVDRKGEAWLRELVRPPSLENLKPELQTYHSNVPDTAKHLTCVAAHQALPLVAVGSGGREKNLFIYEMTKSPSSSRRRNNNSKKNHDQQQLLHRQTVTLPHIYSLSWAPVGRFSSSTVIATGHRDGIVHLVSLPDASNPNPARVVKKFNHAADHLRRSSPSSSASANGLSRISHLEFTSAGWTCAPDSSLLSLYGDSIFLWDLSRGHSNVNYNNNHNRPIFHQRISSINSFHASPFRDGILSLAGASGISLMDVRSKSRGLLRPKVANHWESTVVKWSPYNSNWIASAHEDSKIRIWDIRAAQPFAELTAHADIINSLDWSASNQNELISGSADQCINIWDVTTESFAYDSAKSKEKYFSKIERAHSATINKPNVMENSSSLCRRRGLFTILEDPDNAESLRRSTTGDPVAGVKSYKQPGTVLQVAAIDSSRNEFCSINTECQIALHQTMPVTTSSTHSIVDDEDEDDDYNEAYGGLDINDKLRRTGSNARSIHEAERMGFITQRGSIRRTRAMRPSDIQQ
ncbi:WD40-repeat-containing domain protein [Lipomyces japonicus]|uniref:WD40-repeat-containing domain protein n=1 Tax=Lipomyces japonicus TaxID=56871 RepID=UPI0034CF77E1